MPPFYPPSSLESLPYLDHAPHAPPPLQFYESFTYPDLKERLPMHLTFSKSYLTVVPMGKGYQDGDTMVAITNNAVL